MGSPLEDDEENLQSEPDPTANTLATMVVKDKRSGEKVKINKADFNPSLHEEVAKGRVKAKPEPEPEADADDDDDDADASDGDSEADADEEAPEAEVDDDDEEKAADKKPAKKRQRRSRK